MSLGALEETITVTGEAPLVDVQSTQQQSQFQRETLAAIPGTGRITGMANVIPGSRARGADGLQRGWGGRHRPAPFRVHGAPEAEAVVDGMNQAIGSLVSGVFIYNQLTFQEVVIETGGTGSSTGQYHAARRRQHVFGRDDLLLHLTGFDREQPQRRARGPRLAAVGFAQEALRPGWRLWRPDHARSPLVFRLQPARDHTPVPAGQLLQQAPSHDPVALRTRSVPSGVHLAILAGLHAPLDAAGRKTPVLVVHVLPAELQLSLRSPHDDGRRGDGAGGHRRASVQAAGHFEQSLDVPGERPLPVRGAGSRAQSQVQTNTRRPETGGVTPFRFWSNRPTSGTARARSTSATPARTYTSRGRSTRVTSRCPASRPRTQFKAGFEYRYVKTGDASKNTDPNQINQGMDFVFNNRVPIQVRIWAVPFAWEDHAVEKVVFVQDQWTMDRLTLNLGVRYNDVFQDLDEVTLAAGPFVPERTLPYIPNFPHWRNLLPRMGGAYDLFGTGKTAVKGSLGRYSSSDPGDGPGAAAAQPVAEHRDERGMIASLARATPAPATTSPTATCSTRAQR